MLPGNGGGVPQLKTTLSHVSPDKAAQIRSAVTGALQRHSQTGLFCFQRTVETTFVLPWDLNPKVCATPPFANGTWVVKFPVEELICNVMVDRCSQ